MSVTVKTAQAPRPVAVGDVIVSKPFGGVVAARGRVFLVTEHVAYFRCTPRSCPGCKPNRHDVGRQPAHSVWRIWLDWYRENGDGDREVQADLAGREVRVWDAGARRYVDADADLQPIQRADCIGAALDPGHATTH